MYMYMTHHQNELNHNIICTPRQLLLGLSIQEV
jgi:hypothetical protein